MVAVFCSSTAAMVLSLVAELQQKHESRGGAEALVEGADGNYAT
jgi:hypothetical protein